METGAPAGRTFFVCHVAVRNIIAVLILFLALPAGCTVLEDRTDCPCRLRLDLSAIPFPEVLLSLTQAGDIWQDVRIISLPLAEDLVVTVPKGKTDVLAVFPSSPEGVSRRGWEIAPGEDCPPVYMGAQRVDTDREAASCRLSVHKNFCLLTLRLASAGGGGEPFPFRLDVRGNVSGFTPEGVPREGPFSYTLPAFDPAGTTCIGLPRQKDASLRLDVLFTDDVLRSFALGELMARGGYDWSEPDLKDMEMTLDYARTRLTLRSGAWQESVDFEKVL